ncbi:MAG: restriction endonuclease subunit S, partial [Treponema sp.]|nr:restriction endonuclease subunit S [Treponema sp.]
MKDSRIEWIGEIPEEWEIDKCNRVFQIIGSGTTPRGEDIFENGTENWLQSGDVKEGLITTCKNKLKKQVLQNFNALKKYKSPFIIIAMYGASVGNIAISQIDACVNQACCVLGSPKSNFKFLYYALLSTKDFLIKKALGGGQPNISQEIVRQLWLPNPSGIIQQKIADFLD